MIALWLQCLAIANLSFTDLFFTLFIFIFLCFVPCTLVGLGIPFDAMMGSRDRGLAGIMERQNPPSARLPVDGICITIVKRDRANLLDLSARSCEYQSLKYSFRFPSRSKPGRVNTSEK